MAWDALTNLAIGFIWWFGLPWAFLCNAERKLRESGDHSPLPTRDLFMVIIILAVIWPFTAAWMAVRVRQEMTQLSR